MTDSCEPPIACEGMRMTMVLEKEGEEIKDKIEDLRNKIKKEVKRNARWRRNRTLGIRPQNW